MRDMNFAMDELDILMKKVVRVHGGEHPELIRISECYDKIREAILNQDTATARQYLEQAADLSNQFTLPSDACVAYTRVYEAFRILQDVL